MVECKGNLLVSVVSRQAVEFPEGFRKRFAFSGYVFMAALAVNYPHRYLFVGVDVRNEA